MDFPMRPRSDILTTRSEAAMRRRTLLPIFCALLSTGWLTEAPRASAGPAELERTVIDSNFPGAYQVEIADVNGDQKPDVVALGGGTCAWYENPTWKKRIISGPAQTPGIISSATADITGDGRAEIAIAYEFEYTPPEKPAAAGSTPPTAEEKAALELATRKKGKLAIATQGANPDDPWTITHVADVGSIHRLRWGDFNADGRLDLAVAPIFGPRAKAPTFDGENASVSVFYFKNADGQIQWESELLFASFPVLHAIDVQPDPTQNGRHVILTASNTGVSKLTKLGPEVLGSWTLHPLVAGAPGVLPKTGSSEVHVGTLADKQRFLTTIEPWHGSEVVFYVKEKPADAWPGKRHVIDDQIMDGHALCVADVDGDGNDEIFAGHRGLGHRVSMYTYDPAQKTKWKRTVVDPAIAAQDLRAGDLDGDGRPDVVAVGGETHNVVWYHPRKQNP